jgi:GMP synthase (glutamine-hydrolysing)
VTKPLLVLVTGDPVLEARRAHGSYADMIRFRVGDAWTGPWHAVDLRDALELPTPRRLAGVIVTGSASHVTDGEPWVLRGLGYLRELVDAGTPTLGICFGHQMLGEALGGKVGRNPNGREIGTVELEHLAENPLLQGEPPMLAQTTHLDSVLELPPAARVVARSKLEPHAVVQFGPRAWGVQFHPEMDDVIVRHYIDARRDVIEREGTSTAQLLRALDPGHAGAAALPRFVSAVVKAQ